jgi:hypothetical protein
MTKASSQIHTPKKLVKPEDITVEDLQHMSRDSFALWALTSGARVDSNTIDFNSHRYLLPLYMDDSREIVWQKAAQLGATIWSLLKILWWLENHQGRKAGLYFPTKEGVDNLSKDRLTPLIQSCPSIAKIADVNDKLGLRKIGSASFYLYHLGGVASKDSVPLDFIAFDEVRLCSEQDIDQALERISHSPYKQKMFVSTAGLPNGDVNRRFLHGSQHVWLSRCGCPEGGVDLARTFPDCVIEDPKRKLLYLRCPKCKYTIKDPQNGRYVAHNPGADFNSYHVSQLASKYISLKEVWNVWKRTTNLEEFYNAKLGLPYIDEANRGVTREQLEACINTDLTWETKQKERNYCAMGVDQGAGYCMVIIADKHNDKKRIRHVEVIEQGNPDYMVSGKRVTPFARLRELMDEFGVRLCVVDAMPNVNDAVNFAQDYPGRVFLAHYTMDSKDVVQWTDKSKYKATVAKAGPLLKFKYSCVLGRFSSLSVALGAWKNGDVICPNPEGLRQMCSSEKTGQLHPEAPPRRMFQHLSKLIKKFHCTNEETGEGRWKWIHTGEDHLAHSWNYCNVALERLSRRVIYAFA